MASKNFAILVVLTSGSLVSFVTDAITHCCVESTSEIINDEI